MTTDITELAQRVPERKRHDWSQSVMRDCDFCNQWSLTVKHEDGARICASCCDAEYTSKLEVANSALVEALEKAQQRNGELETYSKTTLEFREAARDENRHLKLELEIAEKRIAELESRTVTVKLVDINEFLADVHDKTLALAFRRLAEGVREADIAALTAQGIKWEAE
ncbi:TPA: hypothetical protein L9217_000790 [Klebsiella aerogenes]|nr:hypothetical protein [Klebsiella aerogenes]HBW0040641.1 hypothetical protein [Klebsiella aerogenes]